MSKLTKRAKLISEKYTPGKFYSLSEAIVLLQSLPPVKFVESIELCINLGIDPRKSEQTVRGAVVLPNGTGKKVRIAVFAANEKADTAKEAGADIVGFEDLAEKIKQGFIDFDILIATPDAMKLVGQLGQILGPRGLMPNPKIGTVTNDIAAAVKNARAGQVSYRADKGGVLHCAVGKLNFTTQAIQENIFALLADVKKSKPSTAKGVYLKKIVVSSTMGPGLVIDPASLEV